MDSVSAARKVRSLLALAAPGSGGTGPERANARSKAEVLMAERGWAEADAAALDTASAPVCTPPGGFSFSFSGGPL